MSYKDGRVKLRNRGLLPVRFYRTALAVSATVNVVLIAALCRQADITTAVSTVRSLMASLK